MFRQCVDAIMAQRDISVLDEETFTLFCKNSAQIDVVEMRSLHEELKEPTWSDVADELMDPESSAQWLLAIKAYEAASDSVDTATVDDALEAQSRGQEKKAVIGDLEEDSNADFERLSAIASEFTKEMGSEVQPNQRHIKELIRYGKAKLHCISSYMGGVAGTEACKLIMSQYIPMNNTLVFDGIHGRGSVFNL